MIKKIIACSDIHFKSYKGIDEKKESLTDFINQCKQIVEENGKESVRIIVAGDIFDNKISISNESILAVWWFFKELDNICKTYVIAGNHDFLEGNSDRVDSILPIFTMGDFKNLIYLDKELDFKSGYYVDDNITFALWSRFEGLKKPDLINAKHDYPDNTIVGIIHGDVNGSTSINNTVSFKGVDPDEFKECEFVVAGHIHKHQEIKENGVKIVYCSSITQKDFGESINSHGYVLWEVDEDDDWDYTLKNVDNCGRCYYKFVITGLKDLEEGTERILNLD